MLLKLLTWCSKYTNIHQMMLCPLRLIRIHKMCINWPCSVTNHQMSIKYTQNALRLAQYIFLIDSLISSIFNQCFVIILHTTFTKELHKRFIKEIVMCIPGSSWCRRPSVTSRPSRWPGDCRRTSARTRACGCCPAQSGTASGRSSGQTPVGRSKGET